MSQDDERGMSPRQWNRYFAQGWTLREDGIFDEIAVDIAVNGIRRVRLTVREREAAIRRCRDLGLNLREICERLHITEKTAQKGLRAWTEEDAA